MVELDPDRAADCTDRQLSVQPAVLDAQVIEVTQGLASEIPQLGMVPLDFQLGNDDYRQDHLVLIEAGDGCRVGEQDAGVEYVSTATLGFGHADSPGRRDGPGAKTGHRRVGWTGPGPQKGRAGPSAISPARNARSTKIRGPSRERRRAVHHYRRYPGSCYGKSTVRLLAGVSPGNPGPTCRIAGSVPRRNAAPAGSPPCGRQASRRRRSRTPSGCSATAGTRPAAARPRSG